VYSIDKLKILQTFKYFYILNILLVDVMLILYTFILSGLLKVFMSYFVFVSVYELILYILFKWSLTDIY